jgi:hypothetical protein
VLRRKVKEGTFDDSEKVRRGGSTRMMQTRLSNSGRHGVEELLIALGALHLGEQKLHGVDDVEWVEKLAKNPDSVENVWSQK